MLAAIRIQLTIGMISIMLYNITILGLVLVVIVESRDPLETIPWIIVLLLTPGIRLPFYFLFGQDNRKQRTISRHTYKHIMKRSQEGKLPQDVCVVSGPYRPLSTLSANTNRSSLLYGTQIMIYTSGADKLKDLPEKIQKATHHIYIQYYIFCDGEIGGQVQQFLIKKVKEGVKACAFYDNVDYRNVKDGFFKEIRGAGTGVYVFLRVTFPVLTDEVNYRSRRKIIVTDGKAGFMGGMSVADRYNKRTSRGIWGDTHSGFVGKGVHGLQSVFLIDWCVISKKPLNDRIYYPTAQIYSNNIMRIVISGPVGRWRTLLQATIFMVVSVKEYIFIRTPYFLPTKGLNQALQTAVLGEVSVRLMLPECSDTRSTSMVSYPFIDEIVEAGVRIYLYKPGFSYPRLVISDGALTSVGSANMSLRSLEHDFRVNAFVYQEEFVL